MNRKYTKYAFFLASVGITILAAPSKDALSAPSLTLEQRFVTPPDSARPWVYWYFMDGNLTREGIHADLEAMKKAGIGGAIYLEVGIGVPRGPVEFMSPKWQELFAYAVSEAKRLGLQIALGTGPGWAGSGGPWVKPEESMQHLVSSQTKVTGPTRFDALLPRPEPRKPYFGEATLYAGLKEKWLDYYQDEIVLAFPTPKAGAKIDDIDGKALYYRAPYSSSRGVPPNFTTPAVFPALPAGQTVPTDKIVVLTSKMGADGKLTWDVPAGDWTIMRFGRTITGQTTRPAPRPGLGFESDKFSAKAIDDHLDAFTGNLFKTIGPKLRTRDGGLSHLHFDSWEMGSQNWTQGFQQEFIKRRGYDPLPYLPAMNGFVVDSVEKSERFLWDLRQTSSELVLENHVTRIKEYAHKRGLEFSAEGYDMNPAGDLDLSGISDLPMGEFWSQGFGFKTEFSVREAVSAAHTNGRKVIGAEAFTASVSDVWLQHPGSMKDQLDWALCAGINKMVIHRYQHQPELDKYPGMTMGKYGVHWERTQTWWDMVPAFHQYMSRTSEVLREGLPVSDILYLTPEGAPQVFTPPNSALTDGLPDRKGYSFDGCSPKTLMARATVKNGQIVFPDGTSYRLLVLPQWTTMTPALASKISQLVLGGATIVGAPPRRSPSLTDYPASDAKVAEIAKSLWGESPSAAPRSVGKGRVYFVGSGKDVPRSSLADASWIWFNEGDPTVSAPRAARYFKTSVQIEANQIIEKATARMTADNSFELFVNGQRAGSGDDFKFANELEITSLLKAGTNDITVIARNLGDVDGPAGLIGAIDILFKDGSKKVVRTGADWNSATTPEGLFAPSLDLGSRGVARWKLETEKTGMVYPEYEVAAAILKGMGVAPDFTAGAPMRYIHRRLDGGELYFVANATNKPIQTTATFRVTGYQPEWWDAVTGKRRDLTSYTVSQGSTSIPLRLTTYESGFVVFRKPLKKAFLATDNFPAQTNIAPINGPWNVSFNPKWGGPAAITFTSLDDWSKRPEPGIKFYSGKATYSTSFNMPAGAQIKNGRYGISLGVVKNIASVRVNGKDLGVVWCDPWRVDVPVGLLKPTGNKLEVTVANLWFNRLVGDSGKPAAEKFTSTTFDLFKKLEPDTPLQPSGLLGPVSLDRTVG